MSEPISNSPRDIQQQIFDHRDHADRIGVCLVEQVAVAAFHKQQNEELRKQILRMTPLDPGEQDMDAQLNIDSKSAAAKAPRNPRLVMLEAQMNKFKDDMLKQFDAEQNTSEAKERANRALSAEMTQMKLQLGVELEIEREKVRAKDGEVAMLKNQLNGIKEYSEMSTQTNTAPKTVTKEASTQTNESPNTEIKKLKTQIENELRSHSKKMSKKNQKIETLTLARDNALKLAEENIKPYREEFYAKDREMDKLMDRLEAAGRAKDSMAVEVQVHRRKLAHKDQEMVSLKAEMRTLEQMMERKLAAERKVNESKDSEIKDLDSRLDEIKTAVDADEAIVFGSKTYVSSTKR